MVVDWDENAKYILSMLENMYENQKELSTKVDTYHGELTCQRDACSKNFVSKWTIGTIITIMSCFFLVIGINNTDMYNKISTNSINISKNEVKIEKCLSEYEEVIKTLNNVCVCGGKIPRPLPDK